MCTFSAVEFAKVVDGEIVRASDGGIQWDPKKLDNWYYRRWLQDFEGSTSNQRSLDLQRAKWQSFANMQPYYKGIVDAACALGILERNKAYNEDIKDADGVPTTFIASWVKGQQWRFVSFDESRLTNDTHGKGANRKGRAQRTWTSGPADDGECVGLSHATRSMSIVGGSNGAHESVPLWLVLSCLTLPRNFSFGVGPRVLVNGKVLQTHGSCNKKGSVNSENALKMLDESIIPMLQAHDGTSETMHALMTCDCVGPHMTLDFLEKCYTNFIDLYPRTINLSQLEQFEDLR